MSPKEMLSLALENHKQKKFNVAINLYNEVLKITPNESNVHNHLGLALQSIGKNLKAINCYEEAIKINPSLAIAHFNLGAILQLSGNLEKSMICYEKAIEIDPNYIPSQHNLGTVLKDLGEDEKAIDCFENVLKIDPASTISQKSIAAVYISQLKYLKKAIISSYKSLRLHNESLKFINPSIPLFRLKHDVQQAEYISQIDNSSSWKLTKNADFKKGASDRFHEIGNQILNRKENKENDNDSNKLVLLNKDEINSLLPFYKEYHIYQPKKISGSCINPNKNWQDVEDEYLNSSKKIMFIDDFLSDEALQELREFCLVSTVWNQSFNNKYLGAFSDSGFISQIHLQIAIDLKKKLPKLFGPHKLGKFWGFKYDSSLGKGINIHADFAIHNLNFWITPDEYNNDKNSGGLKIYDVPAPDHWTFKEYNGSKDMIYKFLKDSNANCINIPYKFNRAVLFNSAYFHETDEIDFKDDYQGRRINNTYLFGNRLVKNKLR